MSISTIYAKNYILYKHLITLSVFSHQILLTALILVILKNYLLIDSFLHF